MAKCKASASKRLQTRS